MDSKVAPFIPVSVIVLTKNEETAIEDCINSARDFMQILVVDSKSTDKTIEIASSLGASIINFEWNGKYPKKKQWALNLPEVKFDWVLFIDADERITPSLARQIERFLAEPISKRYAAIEIPLSYSFAGKRLRWGLRMYKRAFLNRRHCEFPVIDDLEVSNMWEVEGHYQPIVKEGIVGSFKSFLIHEDPDSLFHYFARHNRYSDWEAFLFNRPEVNAIVQKARTGQGKIFNRLPFKSFLIFFYSYVLKLGFLDGKPGFHFAVSRSYYYWQIKLKSKELQNAKIKIG